MSSIRLRERIGTTELEALREILGHGDSEGLIRRVVALINVDVGERQAGIDGAVGRKRGIGANRSRTDCNYVRC